MTHICLSWQCGSTGCHAFARAMTPDRAAQTYPLAGGRGIGFSTSSMACISPGLTAHQCAISAVTRAQHSQPSRCQKGSMHAAAVKACRGFAMHHCKPHTCLCGCSGTHHCSPALQAGSLLGRSPRVRMLTSRPQSASPATSAGACSPSASAPAWASAPLHQQRVLPVTPAMAPAQLQTPPQIWTSRGSCLPAPRLSAACTF